ncbi:protein phosphatase 2C 29 [Impatiens glandulifera]|uniref:protein phosphatase 2C 29 n=1 Tax=Impatiens glandulifera TaxID=253017 RepID=UPI001FB0B513|nr:protein phosphatase 2C 29 [Impatiens glandulifera]
MGNGISQLFPCFNPATHRSGNNNTGQPELIFTASDSLDETLGHSFCYVRSSARFISPTPSDRFVSPSNSLRFSPSHEASSAAVKSAFKAISGASVSANTWTPRTVSLVDSIYDDATEGVKSTIGNGFESTSSFCSLPLQPVPRGGEQSGQIERAFFMSGPIERGALSGPLEGTGGNDGGGRVPFSAPLGGTYGKKKKRKGIPRIGKSLYRNFSERKRPWVVPVRNLVSRKEVSSTGDGVESEIRNESNVQWALGKAGEDRVHVVISEEHGWLFVGIYDGFNGPDAPEFLMGNLYKAVYKELEGLFWDSEGGENTTEDLNPINPINQVNQVTENDCEEISNCKEERGSVKKVTFQSEQPEFRRRRLWELLAEDDTEEGLDLSGSDRFAFSVDEALRVNNSVSGGNRRSLLLSKLKHGLIKHTEGNRLFPWKSWSEAKEKREIDNRVEDRNCTSGKKRTVGPIDHESVLSSISRALEATELSFLDMTDKFLDTNPELALMGSCLLVVLMRDEDVYVMNVGDSRAIVAQSEVQEDAIITAESVGEEDSNSNMEDIVEESNHNLEKSTKRVTECSSALPARLTALQLSTDHSTSIEDEVIRIKKEHPDDSNCIVNDRVKGRLKVTRAFGAGSLKQAKLNDALLEMFRNEYIGSAPYISCSPSLCHHRLCPRDQFIILSSDGLYQYLTNQEVVTVVESFMEKFPDGDPAQHLIEELLVRAAKKAGMDFHELLDIPQGDRRKYHDDVTVMVISLEGRIWKSSGKYV